MAWNEILCLLIRLKVPIDFEYTKNDSKVSHQKPMAESESSAPKNSPFAIASILVQMDSIELTRFEVAEYPFEADFSTNA